MAEATKTMDELLSDSGSIKRVSTGDMVRGQVLDRG